MTDHPKRADADPPLATSRWGWRYHHMGIPTTEIRPGERHIPHLKFHVSGFPESPYGIEWMRFEPDSPIHPLVQTVPHVAFVVDDLDAELARRDFTVLTAPNRPSGGVRVAMIVHNGAPVELIEFRPGSDA